MNKLIAIVFTMVIFAVAFFGPAYAGWNPLKTDMEKEQVADAIANFKNSDPSMKVFFDKAYGYTVFPTVTKGAYGIGGAYGEGEVFKEGKLIGYSTLKQLTIGLQLGGQVYSEIIFFEDKRRLDDFKDGNFEFGAQVSAVAVTAGVSADAAYNNGVAIFTIVKGGLMYEASVGGQRFSYDPK